MRHVHRRWDPWNDLDQLQREMNRLFSAWQPGAAGDAEYPAINLYQNQDSLLLTAELPGLDPEQLDLTVTSDRVTLRSTQRSPKEENGSAWHRRERPDGTFSRTITLPVEVDPQRVEATCEKGVLTLKLPRPEEHKPRKITIQSR
jgi:HSP20 family protein